MLLALHLYGCCLCPSENIAEIFSRPLSLPDTSPPFFHASVAFLRVPCNAAPARSLPGLRRQSFSAGRGIAGPGTAEAKSFIIIMKTPRSAGRRPFAIPPCPCDAKSDAFSHPRTHVTRGTWSEVTSTSKEIRLCSPEAWPYLRGESRIRLASPGLSRRSVARRVFGVVKGRHAERGGPRLPYLPATLAI